jgi:hypothetical protein
MIERGDNEHENRRHLEIAVHPSARQPRLQEYANNRIVTNRRCVLSTGPRGSATGVVPSNGVRRHAMSFEAVLDEKARGFCLGGADEDPVVGRQS